MASYNSCTIIGNVGGEVVKRTAGGKSLASFSVAVNDKRGGQEVTEWFRVTAWEKLGDLCAQYLSKGREVQVVGRVSLNKFTGKNGPDASLELNASSVTFLGKGERAAAPPPASEPVPQPAGGEDDIPF